MSDPIRDLENLMHEGIDVNPLPASEVRRRGTRLRRRNNALIGAGALAVALVVGTPLAVVASGNDRSDKVPVAPSPSRTTNVEWRQSIPGSSSQFDLTALPASAGFSYEVRPLPAVDDLSLCGAPAFATGAPTGPDATLAPALDTLGAVHGEAGSEGSTGRTLALYPDDRVAAQVVDAVRQGVEACPSDPNGRGAPLVNAPVDTSLPADDSFVFTQQARMDADLLSDLTVFQVARVGNAVYLATDHTAAGGPQVADAEVRRLAEWSAPVLSDMCVFAAEPCDRGSDAPSSSASPAIGEGAVSAIPADFPLDAGIVGPEGKLDGPSTKAQGVAALDLCGRAPWPAKNTVERLAVTSLVPEYSESRELVTFSRTEDASAVLDQVREAAQACAVVPGDRSADDRLVDLQPVEAGDVGGADDVVTVSIAFRKGLGGSIWQLARVGRAVYATQVVGEFAHDSIGQAVDGVSESSRGMVPRLCPWTETGC